MCDLHYKFSGTSKDKTNKVKHLSFYEKVIFKKKNLYTYRDII